MKEKAGDVHEVMPDSFSTYLYHEGTNYRAYEIFTPHCITESGSIGWRFAVWAPAAKSVSLVGDFNDWDTTRHIMTRDESGIWCLFVEGLQVYDSYKYAITGSNGKVTFKSDPYGVHQETMGTASKLYHLDGYKWHDDKYLSERKHTDIYSSPINIYEVHLGSWRKKDNGDYYSYREVAHLLVDYCKKMGYTHIELMPIAEYPFDGSWGYQVTGLFAPTSRYGVPFDFMYFVDTCHKAGIGVILDWVVAHFPKDEHGLSLFDGDYCYEYSDPTKGEHIEWGTKVFDYNKGEVVSMLISSAMYWCEYYHIDGLRVDAVASMIYLDYARKDGEWHPNREGTRYNLEAIEFLRKLNTAVLTSYPDVMMIAEESTAFAKITKPSYDGGLGFNFKWNMGWMNDALSYLDTDPFFRKGSHDKLTFSITYAFAENYILPLSHDEVVHGKRSLLNRCKGEYDDMFENYKTFLGYYMTHPGKKLLFMGSEFGQFIEWDYKKQLDWFLLDYPRHKSLLRFTKELNQFYLAHHELYERDCDYNGFRWIVVGDSVQNIYSYIRYAKNGDYLIIILNFSNVDRPNYVMGVPDAGNYSTVFTSASSKYMGKLKRYPSYKSRGKGAHGYPHSIRLKIYGNSITILKNIKV